MAQERLQPHIRAWQNTPIMIKLIFITVPKTKCEVLFELVSFNWSNKEHLTALLEIIYQRKRKIY